MTILMSLTWGQLFGWENALLRALPQASNSWPLGQGDARLFNVFNWGQLFGWENALRRALL